MLPFSIYPVGMLLRWQYSNHMVYVMSTLSAGDRVVADPLCKPFSMGRNLFCVHSRKRMDDIPELKAEKTVSRLCTLALHSCRHTTSCPSYVTLNN